MGLEEFGRSLLLRMDPERAHWVAKQGMKLGLFAPGRFQTEESRTRLFDVELDNPFGIAAGFDKYAELPDKAGDYGFGWIECGSFTFEEGKGNKKKRLFRLEDGSVLNRMGLNNCGAAMAAERFSNVKDQNGFAVNIAKTHDPGIVGDDAINDVANSYVLLKNFGIYTAINVSCPNTAEGKTFEEPGSFRDLNSALREVEKGRPLVYKFSPGLDREVLESLVEISDGFADGYEVVNTMKMEHPEYGGGGLSGPRLKESAVESIMVLRRMTDKLIIGVGGISTGEDSYELRKAGANAFLAYTGFVGIWNGEANPNAGSRFAHKVNREHFELVRRNSFRGNGN